MSPTKWHSLATAALLCTLSIPAIAETQIEVGFTQTDLDEMVARILESVAGATENLGSAINTVDTTSIQSDIESAEAEANGELRINIVAADLDAVVSSNTLYVGEAISNASETADFSNVLVSVGNDSMGIAMISQNTGHGSVVQQNISIGGINLIPASP